MSYLDDNLVVSGSEKVEHVYTALKEALPTLPLCVDAGKTRVWNAAGYNSGRVWRGLAVPTHQQGVKILGAPLGLDDVVQAELELVATDHQVLLDRIPGVPDVQAAWLLLLPIARRRGPTTC